MKIIHMLPKKEMRSYWNFFFRICSSVVGLSVSSKVFMFVIRMSMKHAIFSPSISSELNLHTALWIGLKFDACTKKQTFNN